jgi:hypothetical protein
VSECVALCLLVAGAIVTWFVTGSPDLGKVGRRWHVPSNEPARFGRTSLWWQRESTTQRP